MKTKHIVSRRLTFIESGTCHTTEVDALIEVASPDFDHHVLITIDSQFMSATCLREAAALFKKLADVLDATAEI